MNALTTEAWKHCVCPRCKSQPMIRCRTPSGRPALSTHGERVQALFKQFPEEANKCMAKDFTLTPFTPATMVIRVMVGEIQAGGCADWRLKEILNQCKRIDDERKDSE